jgi:hypothetical protein
LQRPRWFKAVLYGLASGCEDFLSGADLDLTPIPISLKNGQIG